MIPNRLAASNLIKRNGPKLFHNQKRHSLYNKYRHGPQKISNPDPPFKEWMKEVFTLEGLRNIKKELRANLSEPFKLKYYRPPETEKLYKFEEFDSDESIKRWKPVADRDSLNGFSECRLTRSPAGHALFSGVLDTQVPDDGMTENSGFVGIIGPSAPVYYPFQSEQHWDWSQFNCLEIKFRGDGRKYQVVVNTGTYMSDLEGYDHHSYFLHTRGGPYWQTLRIPFHKFVFAYKNFIQDDQLGLRARRVKFVAITLQDNCDGPFALEIDHIGLINETRSFETKSAYEGYSFSHLRYKQLHVDCPVPER